MSISCDPFFYLQLKLEMHRVTICCRRFSTTLAFPSLWRLRLTIWIRIHPKIGLNHSVTHHRDLVRLWMPLIKFVPILLILRWYQPPLPPCWNSCNNMFRSWVEQSRKHSKTQPQTLKTVNHCQQQHQQGRIIHRNLTRHQVMMMLTMGMALLTRSVTTAQLQVAVLQFWILSRFRRYQTSRTLISPRYDGVFLEVWFLEATLFEIISWIFRLWQLFAQFLIDSLHLSHTMMPKEINQQVCLKSPKVVWKKFEHMHSQSWRDRRWFSQLLWSVVVCFHGQQFSVVWTCLSATPRKFCLLPENEARHSSATLRQFNLSWASGISQMRICVHLPHNVRFCFHGVCVSKLVFDWISFCHRIAPGWSESPRTQHLIFSNWPIFIFSRVNNCDAIVIINASGVKQFWWDECWMMVVFVSDLINFPRLILHISAIHIFVFCAVLCFLSLYFSFSMWLLLL